MKTIAFTGHRPNKIIGKKEQIYKSICDLLWELKPGHCISGMCIGVDLIACEACNTLSIPYTAAVPFRGQEIMWSKEDQEMYNFLLRKADRIKIISDGGYAAWKFQKRNVWMVDNSDILIAVHNGDLTGGTYNTLKYANEVKQKYNRDYQIITIKP